MGSRGFIVALTATLAGGALSVGACVGDSASGDVAGDAASESTFAADSATQSDATESDAQGNLDAGADACAACGAQSCFEGVCGGNTIVEVGAGGYFGCALTKSGSVYCWGDNEVKQLGTGGVDSTCDEFGTSLPCQPAPVRVNGLDHAIHLSVGANAACAIRSDQTAVCWGANESGQLGHDPGGSDKLCASAACNGAPSPVPGLVDPTSIAVGAGVACAIDSGKVKCWGSNARGELGQGVPGSPNLSSTPVEVQGIGAATAVDLGWDGHACALLAADKSIWCWGANIYGGTGHSQGTKGDDTNNQNANGTPHPTVGADQVTTLTGFQAIGFSEAATCGIDSTGQVLCDGIGFINPQGPGPTMFAVPGVASGAVSVDSVRAACAVLGTGEVRCWGSNENGALGLGTISTTDAGGPPPVFPAAQVPGLLAKTVSASKFGMLALRTDAVVVAWGSNSLGQLGHNPSTDSTCYFLGSTSQAPGKCNGTPTPVQGLP